nr:MAG TPA: hypothetical protein [Caudoviricetes sp.]
MRSSFKRSISSLLTAIICEINSHYKKSEEISLGVLTCEENARIIQTET